MVPRGPHLPAVPSHSSAASHAKIANCVTLSALPESGLALCWGPILGLALCWNTVTKSNPTQPDKAKPLGGGVKHDARGNAVWQWATETARHAVASTSQLLRRLDVSSLSLEELSDDQQPPKTPKSPKSRAKPAPPSRERGFNPYDGAAIARAAAQKTAAQKKPPAPVAKRARAPWWRRLFQR
jgi:hypothetical protein